MTARGSFFLQRMGSAGLLLVSSAVSTLVAASLLAALTAFAIRSLPQAVGGDLAHAPGTSISVYGQFGDAQAQADQRAVSASMRRTLRGIPFRQDQAIWSDSIGFPTQGRTATLVQAAAMSHIRQHAELTSGAWPAAVSAGTPVQAAMPATSAAALHLRTGQLLALRDTVTGARVSFRLTGQYRAIRPSAPYWGLDLIGPSGVSVLPGFVTYGPLVVAPGAFGGSGLTVGGATWLVMPDVRKLEASQLVPLADSVAHADGTLANSASLGGLQVATGLPAALAGAAAKLAVARSLLAVSEIELLLLALAALAVGARTLTGQREDELAMLAARGSGRWQLARLALAEALAVNTAAAGAGALIGTWLAGRLAGSGALRGSGVRFSGIPGAVWLAAGLVLLLSTAVTVWPALRPPTPGAARVRRGRGAAVSAVARAGGDVALLLLAALAAWQLREYSVAGAAGGRLGVDPVLALAPALALAATTVIPLRLLPALARGADRLAARTRRLPAALTSWQISRRSLRQSAPMLLVVLAVGTGTVGLAQHQSWRQSAADQSAFAAGADVRANLLTPVSLGRAAAIARSPGVRAAMAVATGLAAPSGGQVLAVDARRAAATVLLRPDQSPLPPAALWRRLIPSVPGRSIALPGRPARLRITAALTSGPGKAGSPAEVLLSVQDATGAVYVVPAGTLPGDGRAHQLVAVLSPDRHVIYPLRLLAATLLHPAAAVPTVRPPRRSAARRGVLQIRSLAVQAETGGSFASPFATGAALASLAGRARPPVLPAVATQAFLRASHLKVGATISLAAAQAAIAVRVVAVVSHFPTVTSPAGGLIIDLQAAQDAVASQSAPALPVTQWWLATAGGRVPAALPAGLALTVRSRLLAALQSDPLSAIPQQAVLAVAVAAALLAALGFSVAIVASVRERRSQSALLAALGVGAAAQTRALCAEALAISGPAAVTGLILGTVLAHLLVPAVTITATAAAPVPPVLVVVPVAQAVILALAVAAVPVLAAAASAAYRPEPAAQLRAAEAM